MKWLRMIIGQQPVLRLIAALLTAQIVLLYMLYGMVRRIWISLPY